MHTRRLLTGLALLLVLAGCGNDSDDSLDDDEQKAAQALSVEFQGNDPSDFDRDVGVCMGKRLVNILSTEKLVAGGLLNEDLTVNEDRSGITDRTVAEGYADAVLACQDVRGDIENRRDRYPDATDKEIDAYVTCVEGIDDSLLKKAVIAAAMREKNAATKQYAAESRACTKKLGPPAKK